MMFRLLLTIFLLGIMPAKAAVKITSGEHATFSRLVFPASDDVTYKVISGKRQITVRLEGISQQFDLSEIFDRIPKTRLVSVEQSQSADNATLTLSLGCNCLGLAYRLNQYLVIDVIGENDTRFAVLDTTQQEVRQDISTADQGSFSREPPTRRKRSELAKNKPKSPVTRTVQTPDLDPRAGQFVPADNDTQLSDLAGSDEAEKARKSLLQQLKAAAQDGLIELQADVTIEDSEIAMEEQKDDLASQEEIEAAIANADALGSIRIRPVDEVPDIKEDVEQAMMEKRKCISGSRLDPENWADERDFNAQLATLRETLLGEFDQPGPRALENLIKFYLHFGFGVEANQLLKTYPTAFPERQMLEQISLIVNGESSNDQDFFGTPNCDGRAGLWRALNGSNDAILGEDAEKTILSAYGELPILMRDQLAKRFIGGLIDNDRIELAEKLLDINERSPNIKESEIKLLKAKLMIKDDRKEDAEDILKSLVAQNAPNYQEALIALGQRFIERGGNLPAGFAQDLENASLENRDTTLGRELFKTMILANLSGGDRLGAFAALDRDGEEILGETGELPDLVSDALEALLDGDATPADVARISVTHGNLINKNMVHPVLKSKLAARLVDDGLSNLALDVLADIPRSDSNRLTVSKALIATGLAEEARQELGILDSPEARVMRARLKSREGDFLAAREELGQSDDPNFFSNLGWLQSEPTAEPQTQDKKSQGRAAASRLFSEINTSGEADTSDPAMEEDVTLEATRTVLETAVSARETAETLVEDP